MHTTVTFREYATTDREASFRQTEDGTWELEHVTPPDYLEAELETLDPPADPTLVKLAAEVYEKLEAGYDYDADAKTWSLPS